MASMVHQPSMGAQMESMGDEGDDPNQQHQNKAQADGDLDEAHDAEEVGEHEEDREFREEDAGCPELIYGYCELVMDMWASAVLTLGAIA